MKKVLSTITALILAFSLCGVFAFAEAENVAADKSYELNGLRDQYLDDDTKKLTNGEFAASSSYAEPQYIGLSANSDYYGTNGFASIIVDLGEAVNVGKVVISLSNHCDAGIGAPSVIKVSVSEDKTTWSEAIELEYESLTEKTVVKAIGIVNVTGQYVKYELTASEGNSWMFVDEIEVYNDGKASSVAPSESDTESVLDDESAPDKEDTSSPATSEDSSATTDSKDNNTVLWLGLAAIAAVVIVAIIVVVSKPKK